MPLTFSRVFLQGAGGASPPRPDMRIDELLCVGTTGGDDAEGRLDDVAAQGPGRGDGRKRRAMAGSRGKDAGRGAVEMRSKAGKREEEEADLGKVLAGTLDEGEAVDEETVLAKIMIELSQQPAKRPRSEARKKGERRRSSSGGDDPEMWSALDADIKDEAEAKDMPSPASAPESEPHGWSGEEDGAMHASRSPPKGGAGARLEPSPAPVVGDGGAKEEDIRDQSSGGGRGAGSTERRPYHCSKCGAEKKGHVCVSRPPQSEEKMVRRPGFCFLFLVFLLHHLLLLLVILLHRSLTCLLPAMTTASPNAPVLIAWRRWRGTRLLRGLLLV